MVNVCYVSWSVPRWLCITSPLNQHKVCTRSGHLHARPTGLSFLSLLTHPKVRRVLVTESRYPLRDRSSRRASHRNVFRSLLQPRGEVLREVLVRKDLKFFDCFSCQGDFWVRQKMLNMRNLLHLYIFTYFDCWGANGGKLLVSEKPSPGENRRPLKHPQGLAPAGRREQRTLVDQLLASSWLQATA